MTYNVFGGTLNLAQSCQSWSNWQHPSAHSRSRLLYWLR